MSKQNELQKKSDGTPLFSENYKWYALGMLTLVGTLSFFDRHKKIKTSGDKITTGNKKRI